MAKKMIPLESIPQTWYMGWTISTQTTKTVTVTLQDSSTTYIDKVTGTGLRIIIEVPNCDVMKCILEPFVVSNALERPAVQGFNIFVEDEINTNYKALLATIMAWPAAS